MADGTLQNGTEKISTDELVTLNGAAVPAGGEKVQRVKVGFGVDSELFDVHAGRPLPVATAAGTSTWAQSLAVTAGATPTVISIASTVAGYQVKGLIAHGTGDGYFVVQVGAITIVSGRTRSTAPMLQLLLPNGISIATASALTVKVTNESGSTADYEVTLLGN